MYDFHQLAVLHTFEANSFTVIVDPLKGVVSDRPYIRMSELLEELRLIMRSLFINPFKGKEKEQEDLLKKQEDIGASFSVTDDLELDRMLEQRIEAAAEEERVFSSSLYYLSYTSRDSGLRLTLN